MRVILVKLTARLVFLLMHVLYCRGQLLVGVTWIQARCQRVELWGRNYMIVDLLKMRLYRRSGGSGTYMGNNLCVFLVADYV
jgi:hypothetical protein